MYNGRSLKHLETFEDSAAIVTILETTLCITHTICITHMQYRYLSHTAIHSVHIEGEHVHVARAGSENGSLFYTKPVVAASSKAKPLNCQWREAQIHACS